ncbi:MAG: hypothetical protein LUB59_01500 [Candidatus Gastranaerophilales bacterium]|nr:hypothetical protein [Candidatus Gastranaerophilales bacterium]
MKVNLYAGQPIFKGVREDRNTTALLKQNNDYSLTEPNQRRINTAIENLAKQRGEENIKFLLDVGENLTYQTNIQNGKSTKNEWKTKLKNAAEESLAHSNPILKEKYEPEIKRVFDEQKELSNDEKAILNYQKSIIKNADLSSIKDNPNENIRNLEQNMDYFITSTETPTKQKRYVMSRLSYFMSPKYGINSQLKDKKTQVLAEMMNDMVINTPESKVPNMKAVNQKTHGMCAAISIARKAAAYEDKPNYVDAILSELDSSDTVKIYDRQNLGSGKRIPVKKTFVDFDYAEKKGYRIIDASTLQWMNIAGMYGAKNEGLHEFNAFDPNNFDAFHDSFFMQNIPDDKTARKQSFYQVLTKAKDEIGSVKSGKIKNDVTDRNNRQNFNRNLELVQAYNKTAKKDIKSIVPSLDKNGINSIYTDLHNMYKPVSAQIDKNPESIRKYSFIPNEEKSVKVQKIKQYFTDKHSEIDNKMLDEKSENLVEIIEGISALEKSLHNSHPLSQQVAQARKLYNAEAVYRASVIVGLAEDDNLTDNLIRRNIPDKETRISEGYKEVINRIEKSDDKKLMAHFAPYFQVEPDDKDGILEGLRQYKNNVDYLTTEGLDSLYGLIGYGNRHELIIGDIKSSKEIINTGDKAELKRAAICLNVKNDKKAVLKEYDKLEKKLVENPQDVNVYREAFNKMGYKNQMNAFVDVFKIFVANFSDRNNPNYGLHLAAFKAINGLAPDASNEDVINEISNIGNRFNMISANIDAAGDMLEVMNDDGTPYFTVSGTNIILKQMEQEGKLVPEKDMKKLQDRFTAIDKLRSQDEFSSRQGKISDPSLYKFTPEEKAAVKLIDNNINAMYSDVVRNLNNQYREIKEPLSKLANYVGTNEGKYWVQKEGQSGLWGDQQVKIFEQLTDKPYYEVKDIDEAIDIIKNGVHSGVSSSSVFHDRMGGHAQYIVDIKDLGPNNKEALFHDNTWGASEHENVWTDSEGLMRTDYSDIRGGELGYITDENWRNGNYVDNLTHKKGHVQKEEIESKTYKKINPSNGDEYDFELMSGIIVQGENPAYKDIAGTIKDALYIPDSVYIETIQKQAGEMTKKQIQKAIFRNETAGQAYNKTYETIMKRIKTDNFNKGIDTLEEYNSLSDNDIVKVAFEKAAVRKRYDDAAMCDELSSAKNMKDIEKIKDKQRQIAKSNFDYAFGKSEDILLYAAYEYGLEISNSLLTVLKDNNIEINEDDAAKIAGNIAVYNKDEKEKFNGSMKDTIDFAVNKAGVQFDEVIPKSEKSEIAREQFKQNLHNTLEKALYFSKEDLRINTNKSKGIRNWIDEKFDPKTDEEFVEIYRNLQDMKKEDFEKLTRDLTDKQLGINDVTGYDMLIKVKAANSNAKSTLKNTLFYDEYKNDLEISKTKPAYKYGKTERKSSGAFYTGTRTFDDLYRTMSFSLNSLEYEKLFNKYKDENFRKYQAIPAYPKMDLDNNATLNQKITMIDNLVNETMSTVNAIKNTVYTIDLVHRLDDYRSSVPEGKKLTPSERRTINMLTGEFITRNYNDKDLQKSVEAANELISVDKNADISEYGKYIDVITKEIYAVEKNNSRENLKEEIKNQTDTLKGCFNVLIDTNIPPCYQRIIKKDINDWMHAEMKNMSDMNGIDANGKLLKLNEQIKKYSKSNVDNKSQNDDMIKVLTSINRTKLFKNSNNQNEEKLKTELKKTEKYTDRFIKRHISPEHQQQVRASFDDYMRKELAGSRKQGSFEDEADMARDKFERDFRKYHLTKHPGEVLKNFLLMSASDAEPLEQKDVYKQYLVNELDLAKFIDIQDALMQAVQTGNASEVKKHFDDYYVYPHDMEVPVSMNSDESIDYMVRTLILQDNTKTGKMFVEKLGLGDRIMKIETKNLKALNPKEKIDNIASLHNDAAILTGIMEEEITKLSNELDGINNGENCDDFISLIDKTKKEFQKNTKEVKNKNGVEKFLTSLDDSKKFMIENPDIDKKAILLGNYNKVLTETGEEINDFIAAEQEYLDEVYLLYNFLLDIHLPEYSKGYKLQQQMKQDYAGIIAYNNTVLSPILSNDAGIEVTSIDE